MNQLADKITDSDRMIFVVKGDETFKNNLETLIDTDYFSITTIPSCFITKPCSYEKFISYLDIINVKMLISPIFIIYLETLDNLDSGLLKEFVSDEFFNIYRSLCDSHIRKRNKLIIVTNDNIENSILTIDPGLKNRTELCTI